LKPDFILHNDTLLLAEAQYLNVRNRATQYGDGLFESIRLVNGKPLFIKDHFKRLELGAQLLKFNLPNSLNVTSLASKICDLAERNLVTKGGRARLTIYREFGGLYAPTSNQSGFILEVEPLENNLFQLNAEGYSVDLFQDIRKVKNKLSGIKTLSGQLYIQAALHCRENKLDNCFLVNERDQILEAYNGNLFVVANGALYTPGLDMGVLAGVMRMQVINTAIKNGLKVYECGLMPQNLLASDEIFITNAIKGIMWVGSYRSKRYFNTYAKKILDFLNAEISQVSLV